MKVEVEQSSEFKPKYLFSSAMVESFEQQSIFRRIITIRGADNIDDSVPLLMIPHHEDVAEKDPFIRFGDNSILIGLHYDFSNTERSDKSYYYSASEEKFTQLKLSQKLASKPPTNIGIQRPLKVCIHEVVSKKQNSISHCIEISGDSEITEKFRIYRPNDNITDKCATTTERVFISSNRIRIHTEATVFDFPESGICHNRVADLSSFLSEAQKNKLDDCGEPKPSLISDEPQTPVSSKYESVCSKTGTPENLNSETCDSITPASNKSSLLSVKSRPGTPFIKKRKFLSKSSVVPTPANSASSIDDGNTFLFTNSSAVKALRDGTLFGKSTGLPRN